MAIFSRRTIDRMLRENALFMNEEQLDEVVARLNTRGFQSLDAEWEIAVLNAFNKVGDVEHEPPLKGPAELDLLFTSHDRSKFLSDITTVSDEGFEKDTPVKAFCLELKDRLWRAGLPYDGWTLSIGTHPVRYGEPRIPAIPPRNEFMSEVFNANFKRFIRAMKEQPRQRHSYQVSSAKTAISLTYDPQGRFFTILGPAYGAAQKKDENPIFYALKAKAQQLKRAMYQGSKGIVLCDGGTDMIHTRAHSSFDFDFNAEDATKEFLRQNQSIDFVLLVTSVWTQKGRHQIPGIGPVRRVKVTLVPNRGFDRLSEEIKQSLRQVEVFFPEPENTPTGARETIRHRFDPKGLRPLVGGWGMSDSEIRISEGAFLGLLSGKVTHEELSKEFGQNPFEQVIRRKLRLREIRIEETAYDESDLIFRFEGRDPALSAFTNPKKKV
jgi:hypothetical protein